MPFFWIIFSYLLGSIPFGYLIGRFSGKNVLEIGWKKTSGSNVFKNIGKWQGILTGILDILKGYLAIFGAQKLGFSNEIQIFSGVAVVCGHNWSLFLKFAGGRGIGTFAGAFLAFSPQIFGFSLIPLVLLALIWNASIGTLLFLAIAILLSVYFGKLGTIGAFTILSLLPIFIKRLSPVKEIKEAKIKSVLIRNRLIFDNDEACLDLRIKRIIKKEKDNPGKITKIIKPLVTPLLLSPKIGWKAVKYGVKMAEKPIKTLFFPTSEKVVIEISIEDLKNMMLAASKKIVLHQEEINKINVWPVADKDTGYNLAATLLGIEGVISQKEYSSILELTKDIKEGAMVNARGNAGMIYAGYLIRFLDQIRNLNSVNNLQFSYAMRKGTKAAYHSITNPVEGTILDVMKVAGEKSYEVAKIKKEKNIIKILEEAQKTSQIALRETKEKLKVLKENDVVDAGALGFVKILEAWIESLKGQTLASKTETEAPIVQPKAEEELKYRYEVISIFKKVREYDLDKIKKELSLLGDSIDILELEDKIKFHIHTDQPDIVKEKFKNFPEVKFQVEDMQADLKKLQKKPLGLVVDEIADLPKEFLEKYDIEEVPFITRLPDGEIITSKDYNPPTASSHSPKGERAPEIYSKMRETMVAGGSLPTNSAPSFKEFFSAYQRALEKFEKILVITVSSKFSGTYSSARIARSIFKKPTKLNIFVFDCNSVEIAEGLMGMKAQELISQGKKMEEVIEILKEFCPKVKLLGCIDDFRYLSRRGRYKLPRLFFKPVKILQKIGIRILLILKDGEIKFLRIRFGKNSAKILIEELDRQRNGKKVKIAIAHADNLKAVEELKTELEKNSGIEILFISSISSVIGTHTGPGALLVAFYPIDN